MKLGAFGILKSTSRSYCPAALFKRP